MHLQDDDLVGSKIISNETVSMVVFNNLLPANCTVKLYHTTSAWNRDSILKHGLMPKATSRPIISYPPRIFFSMRKDDIITRDFINQWDNVDMGSKVG